VPGAWFENNLFSSEAWEGAKKFAAILSGAIVAIAMPPSLREVKIFLQNSIQVVSMFFGAVRQMFLVMVA